MAKHWKLKRIGAAMGFLLAASIGSAFYDTDILIQRALNSPDFSVKYSGAAAAMIELRVNGASVGTQTVSHSKTSGEAIFTLDLLSLNDGDNVVEVRLFDRNGKLLGTQKMNVYSGDGTPSPVKLVGAKSGQTVQGVVEIKVGFGREMRNSYVSFFVDEQFKSMTNAAPYTYYWDTIGELNGWHELEAWVVDENSTTIKTRKVRVFVNNPGGRTNRNNVETVQAATTAANTVKNTTAAKTPAKLPAKSAATTVKQATNAVKTAANTVKQSTTVKTTPVKSAVNTVKTAVAAAKTTATAKSAPLNLSPSISGIKVVTSQAAGLKPAAPTKSLVAGSKISTPQSIPTKLDKISNVDLRDVRNAVDAARMVSITKGARLPDVGTFSILMNSKVVKFDVSPRVQDGIPLAPIRHLFEANGGRVDWENLTKTMFGESNGKKIVVKIGDKIATIDKLEVELEAIPYLENGRTIVPLSFIRDSLQVDVEFDRKTGHVLITSVKRK